MVCTPHPIFSDDQVEKNKGGAACITYGGEETCIQDFDGEI